MRSRERRVEARVRYHGCIQLLIPGQAPVPACVRNVSTSGVSLETAVGVETGTFVCLDGAGILAQGVVRFCRRQGLRYRVGVAIDPLEAA